MCSYCSRGKLITKDAFQKSYIQKALFGYSIVVEYNGCYINSGMINYCPMCGKKLKSDKDIVELFNNYK